MLSFDTYLTDRRFMTSNLSQDGWLFVIYALGDSRYLRVRSWRDLRQLLEEDQVSATVSRGAFLVWRSYCVWKRRKTRNSFNLAYA